MDPGAHRRFLEYLEKCQYFGVKDDTRLDRERWERYDAELAPLRAKKKRDALTAEELIRFKALRRTLLVD